MPAPTSPAAKLLKESGVRAVDVAVVANTTPATVSRWLSGEFSTGPARLATVLQRFLEPDQAAQILDAIPEVRRG